MQLFQVFIVYDRSFPLRGVFYIMLLGRSYVAFFYYYLVAINLEMVKVEFYDPGFVPGGRLTYSVITARYRGKWIFVRHSDRETFEIPGGHIEEGESSDEAARRELYEETGALSFSLHCVATYSVTADLTTGWGRLYFADVYEIGPVNDRSEIEELIYLSELPVRLTYPDIQPHLFTWVELFAGKMDQTVE